MGAGDSACGHQSLVHDGGTITTLDEGLGRGTAARFTIGYKSKVIRKARSTCCIISVDNVPR